MGKVLEGKRFFNEKINRNGAEGVVFLWRLYYNVVKSGAKWFFVVEKLATKLAFLFMRPTDRPQFITYAISLMIVCIMCPVMSLVATLLFKEPSFGMWVHTWGCNMPMALCWQMLYCGPLSRAIFRLLFRRSEKKAA